LFRTPADDVALEAQAARVGFALACPYSSSDEYEASIIAQRRAAGVYGPKRRQRDIAWVFAAVMAAAIVCVAIAG
jgi:hypothetical protein